MQISHCLEPAAKRLERAYPLAAAKLYRVMGFEILVEKRSVYYWTALRHFEAAKRLLLKAGRPRDWEKLVIRVREQHRRQYGFIRGFERLAAGEEG